MPTRIVIKPEQVGKQILGRSRAVRKAIARGALLGAERGKTLIVRKTPWDEGQLAGSWDIKKGRVTMFGRSVLLATLFNDAPHAGIVERGARPHPVGRKGIEALTQWAWRHRRELGIVTASGRARRGAKAMAEARSVAFAIAAKIRLRGQVGTFFVRKNLPAIQKAMASEIKRQIKDLAKRRKV